MFNWPLFNKNLVRCTFDELTSDELTFCSVGFDQFSLLNFFCLVDMEPYCPYVCEMIWMVENPIRATDSKHLRLLTLLQLVADFQQSYQTDLKFKPPPPLALRMRSKSWWLSKSKRVKNRSFKFRAVVLHFSFQQSVPDALESEMKWELFKKSCQFRTKDFRQHGDNIRAAIHFEDQEFAMFTSGIENLVLPFTDNEGEATNICLVHIDPHGKLNISIQ